MNSVFFLTNTVNYLIRLGVSSQEIVLFLILPIIIFIVCFLRQIFGLKTFGIYVPCTLTLVFLILGIKEGLLFFFIILFLALLIKLIFKKVRLMYFCRMALILTIVLIVLFPFAFSTYFQKNQITSFSIFPLLVMILSAERLIAVWAEYSKRQALMLTLGTLFISCFCFWVASWEGLRNAILKYPEIILVTLPFNFLLGRWTGLRLTEYFRFQEIRKLIKTKK